MSASRVWPGVLNLRRQGRRVGASSLAALALSLTLAACATPNGDGSWTVGGGDDAWRYSPPTLAEIERSRSAPPSPEGGTPTMLASVLIASTGADGDHPVNAVLAANPGANEAAERLEAERTAGGWRGPLHGAPILIKDNIETSDMPTTAGSLALVNNAPGRDAPIVARLREAGAVILGKTNLSEWANIRSTNSTSGWSAVGGLTRNPHVLDRNACGSSSGSAAAVAAGLVAAATASDGAGSIRIPAACTGLVGLKPSPRVVPTPESWNGLSTFGFLTRSVADTALLNRVAVADVPSRLRVAWSVKRPLPALPGPEATMLRALDATSATLRGLGHEVFERDPDFGLSGPKVVARFLRGIADDARALAHAERLDRRSRGLARLGTAVPRPLLAALQRSATRDRARIEAVFADADVLVMPVLNALPPAIGAYEGLGAVRSLHRAFNFTPYPALFNHTGLPALAVPVARTDDGFPLAVQLVGPLGSEGLLLALAAQLEVELGWVERRPPGFE